MNSWNEEEKHTNSMLFLIDDAIGVLRNNNANYHDLVQTLEVCFGDEHSKPDAVQRKIVQGLDNCQMTATVPEANRAGAGMLLHWFHSVKNHFYPSISRKKLGISRRR